MRLNVYLNRLICCACGAAVFSWVAWSQEDADDAPEAQPAAALENAEQTAVPEADAEAVPEAEATEADAAADDDDSKPVFEVLPLTEATAEPVPAATSFDPDVLPSGAPRAAAFDEELKPEDMASLQKQVRLQALEVQGLQLCDSANKAKALGNYQEASGLYLHALELLPKRPQTIELRQNIRGELADCEYRMAEDFFSDGMLQEAEEAARRAQGYITSHRKAQELLSKIQRRQTQAVRVLDRPTPIAAQDEFVKKDARIREGMLLGRQYVAIGEYEKAKMEFKKIIMEDPENTEARAQLQKISEDEYRIYSQAERTTIAERMVEVKERWSAPASRDKIGRSTLPALDQPDQGRTGRSTRLSEKLNQIRIPEINFKGASIEDVVDFLRKAAKEGDLTSPPQSRGVNIYLNLRRPGEAAAVAPAAPVPSPFFDDDEAAPMPAIQPVQDLGLPRITLSLQDVPLLEVIRYITEMTGLKYRIEENALVITPVDVVYGQLMTRVYMVQPSLIELARQETSSSMAGDGFDFGATATTSEARHDVKQFFVDAGVPFPEGTSIIYKPSMNKLLVKNTSDNLELFERILAELNVVPTQVEIETRFVEIGQNDLEEIGMEWLMTDNWEIAENASAGSAVMPGGRERIQVNKTDFTKGLRFLNAQGSPSGQTAGRASLGSILSISSILTNPEVSFILHAIEQRSGSNLLSAPKVTTKSGQSAEIKVTRELRYPTDWEQRVEEAGTGGGSGGASRSTRIVITPTDFETRDVGVILSATPMVGPDGYTIDLTLIPQVVEITEWVNYGQDQFDERGNIVGKLDMFQPVFHVRTIATSISIWDGETVVMGGLITEAQTTTQDKIPVLGDLPLLGYLFRSKSSNSVKRNLLIFVTARLVDPAGRVVRRSDDHTIATMTATSSAEP